MYIITNKKKMESKLDIIKIQTKMKISRIGNSFDKLFRGQSIEDLKSKIKFKKNKINFKDSIKNKTKYSNHNQILVMKIVYFLNYSKQR